MVKNFNDIEAVQNPRFKGGEGEVLIRTAVADGKVKIMQITIPADATIGMHTHNGNSEEILIVQGRGHFITGGLREDVHAGDAYYCSENSTHTFINDGDGPVVFFAVVPEHRLTQENK